MLKKKLYLKKYLQHFSTTLEIMSDRNEGLSTPTPKKEGCRRLGLRRRNIEINKPFIPSPMTTTKQTESGSITKQDVIVTPLRQPHSDAKVSYRNRNNSTKSNSPECLAATPETPNMACSMRKESLSTNCRPYRLSLSKRVREKMSKKRLEFHLANEMKKEEEEQRIDKQENVYSNDIYPSLTTHIGTSKTDETPNSVIEPENMSKDQLIAAIEEARKELNSRQLHVAKVHELENAIKVWKIGFSSALQSLQEKMQPPIDTDTLLERLQIPKEMLKHVETN